MDKFERDRASRAAVNAAEADGKVADSIEVRKALVARVHSGEITLAEALSELKSIKRNAKKNGLVTRNQVFTGRG
jgi:hypothetical protein